MLQENTSLSQNKSVLAKLMAAENITVHHRQVKTARFDLKHRVLTCPIWQDMDGAVYDLLMGHEISHALHTPMAGWHDSIVTDRKRPNIKNFLNVIEDARIERLIKNKYPGLRKPFAEAYQKLFDRDLFQIKKLKGNYSKLNLIDRINLYFKLGAQTMIKFSPGEQVFVDRTAAANTWDEVAQIARDVYDYCKFQEPKKDKSAQDQKKQAQAKKNDKKDQSDESEGEGQEPDTENDDGEDGEQDADGTEPSDDADESEDSDDVSDGEDEGDTDASDGEDEGDTDGDDGEASDEESDGADAGDDGDDADTDENSSDSDETTAGNKGKEEDDEDSTGDEPSVQEPSSRTDEAFRAAEDNLVNATARSQMFFDIPDANLKAIIAPHEVVLNKFERAAKAATSRWAKSDGYDVMVAKLNVIFHKKNKDYISLMVKEFEMKKNASAYARQMQAKTGIIDDTKLSRYKFTNDIFRKMTVTTKGKSHGMVLFLDLSGSMTGQMRPIVEQLLILVTFCKRVGIPFDVYGFGNQHGYYWDGQGEKHFKVTSNSMSIGAHMFCLRHLISSEFSASAFRRAFSMLNLLGQATQIYGRDVDTTAALGGWSLDFAEVGFNLNSTPFIQTLLASKAIIKNFKNKHKVDITNVVYLTDGEGDANVTFPAEYNALDPNEKGEVDIGFQDPQTKQRVLVEKGKQGNYQTAITKLIRLATGCRHIGYYFGSQPDISMTLSNQGKATQPVLDDLKKNGYVAIPNLGYDTYYYVAIDTIRYSGTLGVHSSMSRDAMLQNFNSHQKMKNSSKLIIKQFAAEVAE